MRRSFLLVAGVLGLGAAVVAFSSPVRNAVVTFVELQSSSPGAAQLGHVNITGTFRASQMFASSANAATTPVVGNNTSSGVGAIGASFSTFSPTGYGVRATATNTKGSAMGVYGESRGDSGIGVFGTAKGLSSNGVKGDSYGRFGSGVYGVSTGTNGFGLEGFAPNGIGVSVVGETYGGDLECLFTDSTNTLHAGAHMKCDNYGNGPATGGYGIANSFSVAYGLAGKATGTGTKWGLYAFGNSGGTGTKSFEIDHPLSPETMTLRHYSAEGAEPLLEYEGNSTLDSHGQAKIHLPEYVAAIARDFRYQLTPVGAPMPNLYVAKAFADDSFSIAGGAPGKSVSWRLSAVRNDKWVQQHGAPVEVPKPASMRGKFLEPELYGRPESDSVLGPEHSPQSPGQVPHDSSHVSGSSPRDHR